MKRFAIIIYLLLPVCFQAQSTTDYKAEELKAYFNKPLSEWTDTYLTGVIHKFLDLYLDLLWDPGFRARKHPHLPKRRPNLRVELTGEMRTSYVEHNSIVIPIEYLRYLYILGTLVGHDVYVHDHFIDLDNPLLNTPYRKSLLLPLLSPLTSYLDVEGSQILQSYLVCPKDDSRCTYVLNNAVAGTILFLLLHELSHEVFHHVVKEGEYNLVNEIAADKNAVAVLSGLVEELTHIEGEDKAEMRLIFRAAPIVWLGAEQYRDGTTQTIAASRKKSLMDALSPELLDRVEELTTTSHSSDNLSWLEVKWTETPETVLISGVKVPISELVNRRLVVSPKEHTVVGTRQGSIAIVNAHANSIVTMQFHRLADCDPADLELMVTQKHWSDVLICTSDSALSPRKPSLGRDHFFALHGLGLDNYINVDDWNVIPEADWKTLFRWQRNHDPLRDWR